MRQDTFTSQTGTSSPLDAIKANDEKALRALYKANYSKVEKYVLQNRGTSDQAKDIYQEAFISLWRSIQLERIEMAEEDSLERYLFRIAKNKWIDYLRSSSHRNTASMDLTLLAVPAEEVVSEEENDSLAAIKTGFKHLGEICQEVLNKFYYGKEPLKEIADAMGWTEATARNNKYRCLQRLRKMLIHK